MSEKTSVRVSLHPSGRRTLTVKRPDEALPSDMEGALFGNLNEGKFYRAVAIYLATLSKNGTPFDYEDS